MCSAEWGFSDVHQLRDIQVFRQHRDHDSVIFEVTCEVAPDLTMIVIDQASRLQIFHAERALKEQICLTLTGNHLCRIQADCSHKQTPPCLWLTTESHVFTGPPMPIQELIMCVPFCGGISGWQHAVRMLQTCGYPIRTAIACDTSPEAVRSFCSTHGFGLGSVPFSTEVPPGPFAYVADASQGQFWMFAAAQKCNIATASWPCQSFSLAGGRQGWSAPGGLAFKDMLAFCSICGIQFVLLENVPEVWSDLGLRATLIANVLSEGYHFIFAEVLKLEHVVPVQRSRFIGVITKLAHVQWTPQHAGKVKQAFQGPLRSLQLESMWFAEVPAALMTQSLLTSQEIEIYSCVRRSPKQVATAKDALLRRVISPEARIPATSLMRSYTRQHLFHGVAHGTDKLLGDLRTQQDKLRFFTPVEIIAALGITNPVDLPIDIVSGSQQVGNSIAEKSTPLPGFGLPWFAVALNLRESPKALSKSSGSFAPPVWTHRLTFLFRMTDASLALKAGVFISGHCTDMKLSLF